MAAEADDLTPYERERLLRIQQNKEKLRSLGLINAASPHGQRTQAAPPRKRKPKAEGASSVRAGAHMPTRASARLRARDAETTPSGPGQANEMPVRDRPRDPAAMPVEPQELDDSEFEVFVALRRHRLERCRALDIEPYKVAQNRTLCELIRRRRNDGHWAAADSGAPERAQQLLEYDLGCVARRPRGHGVHRRPPTASRDVWCPSPSFTGAGGSARPRPQLGALATSWRMCWTRRRWPRSSTPAGAPWR